MKAEGFGGPTETDAKVVGTVTPWETTIDRRVFAVRHGCIVLLAAAAALIPEMGEHRGWIALSLLALVLPYDIALDRLDRRRGAPWLMAFVDPFVGAAYAAVTPDIWLAALFTIVTALGLFTAFFGRRIALASLGISTVLFGLASLISHPNRPLVGLAAFAVTGGALVMQVGQLFDTQRTAERRYAALVDEVDAIVWEAIPKPCHYTFVNRRAEEVLGYPVKRWYEHNFWFDHIHPDDQERVAEEDGLGIDEGRDHELQYRMIAADGRVVHFRELVTVHVDATGQAINLSGVMIDITEQVAAEQQVRQYAEVVERVPVALFVCRIRDPEHPELADIVAANPNARRLAAIDADNLMGQLMLQAYPGMAERNVPARLVEVMRTNEPCDIDDLVQGQGTIDERHYSMHAFPVGDELVGVSLDDVTGPSLAAQQLLKQATHDALTGLPNRVLLNDRLRQAVREAARTGTPVALLIMDLDQFKEINDALGHHHGDRLLVALSRRLEDVLRDADTIARLGGDEFAILLTTDANRGGAVTVARRVVLALEQPFELEGMSLQTNASIGIALFPDHASDPESLTKRADVAMYMAKRSTNSYAVYAAEHDHSSVRRLTLLGELRRAVEMEELVLYHQPTFDLATREIVGCEALVRWEHPAHGLVGPGEFIDLAEVSGMIQPLTRWAVRNALAAAVSWRDGDGNGSRAVPIGVSVNLSVRNLYDQSLRHWLARQLRESGFPPELLTLEVTESQVMDDPFVAVDMLGQLHELGVHLSIDDFGTGQSSLSYLKHLPIDEIKIDRSFVSAMGTNESDATIVHSIIDLGHNLGLRVVAGGVEDEPTLQRLISFGCDRAQGFLLARPLSPVEAAKVLLQAPM